MVYKPIIVGALNRFGYDPLSFVKLTEAQLFATLKYGAMVGAGLFIIANILIGLIILNRMLGMSHFSFRTDFLRLILIGPVIEEVIFRLVGISALYYFTGSIFTAVLLTSLCFGLGHLYQGPGPAVIHILNGAIYAIVFLTGGIFAAIAAHIVYNFITSLFMF